MDTASIRDRTGSAREAVRRGRRVLAALAAGLITAFLSAPSANAGVISYSEIQTPYSPSEVSYAASHRDLRVVVKGNPFPGRTSPEAAARAVVAAMGDQPGWFVTRYTLDPGETARGLYKVVWLFGVPANTSIYGICRKDAAPAIGKGEVVMAAFCRGERALSYLAGRMGAVDSVDDPGFRRFVRMATRALFPFVDPARDGQPDNNFDL